MKKLSIIAVAGLIQSVFLFGVQADAAETLFSENFDLVSTGALPVDWSVTTNASTSVAVGETPDASDKSLQLDDADASAGAEAWVSFSAQQGPVNASWSFMESGSTTAGEGHHMALFAGDMHAVELFTIDGNLVYRDLDGTDHVLQAVAKDTWYDVTVAADPTHFTADVSVDGASVLTNATFQHTTTRLNGILFGSSDAWAADTLYVNDITVSKADLVLDETFDAMTTDAEPSDWQVTTNTDTAVAVSETPSSTNKSMWIIDASTNGFSEVWKSFDPMDRPFTASWNFMVTGNEEGHRMQLLSGTNIVFELATDSSGILRYTRPSSAGYDLGVPTPNVWHQIDVTLNLAARKADVYLDGVLKWSHRELLNTSVSYIDRLLFGSSDVTEQYDLYVDDVAIDAEPVYVIEPLDVSTPRVPIVLKLDDLMTLGDWWRRATDFASDRQLSISPGIFGNSLTNSPSPSYISYVQELYDDPSVEIFLHTYDHIDPEFQGTGYTYQKNHVEWTQSLFESYFGSRLTVFGASFNKTDSDTVQVLSEDSDIDIWLFCNETNTAGKTPLYRVSGVNIEESTFIPDPEAFVTGYNANVDTNDYFVIQGHPGNWTDARWYNYVRLIDYLEDNDIPTMTPSALVSMLSGPDTNAPAAPASVTAVAGDNTVFLDWADNAESDVDSYTVYRSTTSGTSYSVLASNLTDSACEDSSAVNGTTYYYVVTATDTSTNESPTSAEVSATPAVDSTAPSAPTGLVAVADNSAVSLDWDDNAEPDLATYTVYRSTTSGSGYSAIASNLASSAYGDSSAVNDTTYYYVVTATDVSGNESATSTEVSALPQASTVGYWRFEGGSAGNAIITAADSSGNGLDGEQWSSNVTNVLYSADVAGAYIYDPLTFQTNANTGSMVATGTAAEENSQIVVHGMSGQVAGSWTLETFVKAETDGGAAVFAGGSNNRLVQFDGSLICQVNVGANGDSSSTYVKFRLDSTTIQNYSSVFLDGAWHHLAYVADYDSGTTNTTITIYKDSVNVASTTVSGEFAASGDLRFGISGVYNGMSNIDWFMDDVRLSAGALSTNQFLQVADEDPNAGGDTTPPAAPTGLAASAGESSISLDWDDNAESDLAGYTVYRSTTGGSEYGVVASNLTVSTCEDSSAVSDITYYYVVTATDTSTNESAFSTEASASIQTQTETNNLLTTINVQGVVVLTGGTTQSGTVYRLQYTEQLGSDTWTTLPFYFEGGDTDLFFIDPANISAQRYYRLIEE